MQAPVNVSKSERAGFMTICLSFALGPPSSPLDTPLGRARASWALSGKTKRHFLAVLFCLALLGCGPRGGEGPEVPAQQQSAASDASQQPALLVPTSSTTVPASSLAPP